MTEQVLPRRPVENWETERNTWIAELEQLIGQAEAWSNELGWVTSRDTKQIAEDSIGIYDTPVLWIQTAQGRLLLDPIARYVMAADGRVDLCALPSYDPAVIVKIGENWGFWSFERNRVRFPWSKEALRRTALEILSPR